MQQVNSVCDLVGEVVLFLNSERGKASLIAWLQLPPVVPDTTSLAKICNFFLRELLAEY